MGKTKIHFLVNVKNVNFTLHTLGTAELLSTISFGYYELWFVFQYARTSFPLCMRQMHEIFRTEHHLKYGARQQYGLFIKGIGVSLEDSLRHWREEFCKKIDLEKVSTSMIKNRAFDVIKRRVLLLIRHALI